MSSGPSPFEPGYEPPPGARLSPPPTWTASSEVAPERAPGDGPEPSEEYGPPPEDPIAPPKRGALTAVFTLLIGLVIGFGAGFFSAYDSESKTTQTPSLSPSVEPSEEPEPQPDPDEIGSDSPEPRAVPPLDPRFRQGLEFYHSDNEMRFGHNKRGSTPIMWNTTFFTDEWAITPQAPRDVTEEILELSSSNVEPAPGNRYYFVELEIARNGEDFAAPGAAIDVAHITDRSVTFESCGSYPNRLTNAHPMHFGDIATVNICMSLPQDDVGRWQFQIDQQTYFHAMQQPDN